MASDTLASVTMEDPRHDLASGLLNALRVLPLLLEHVAKLGADIEGELPALGVLRRAHVEAYCLSPWMASENIRFRMASSQVGLALPLVDAVLVSEVCGGLVESQPTHLRRDRHAALNVPFAQSQQPLRVLVFPATARLLVPATRRAST